MQGILSSLANKGHPCGHELRGDINGHNIAERQTEAHMHATCFGSNYFTHRTHVFPKKHEPVPDFRVIETSRNHACEYGCRFVHRKIDHMMVTH